jgi:hypothetical protein
LPVHCLQPSTPTCASPSWTPSLLCCRYQRVSFRVLRSAVGCLLPTEQPSWNGTTHTPGLTDHPWLCGRTKWPSHPECAMRGPIIPFAIWQTAPASLHSRSGGNWAPRMERADRTGADCNVRGCFAQGAKPHVSPSGRGLALCPGAGGFLTEIVWIVASETPPTVFQL